MDIKIWNHNWTQTVA